MEKPRGRVAGLTKGTFTNISDDFDAPIMLVEDTSAPPQTKAAPLRRVAGLSRGVVTYISDDFDAELPDAFWLGED